MAGQASANMCSSTESYQEEGVESNGIDDDMVTETGKVGGKPALRHVGVHCNGVRSRRSQGVGPTEKDAIDLLPPLLHSRFVVGQLVFPNIDLYKGGTLLAPCGSAGRIVSACAKRLCVLYDTNGAQQLIDSLPEHISATQQKRGL